MPRFFCDYSNTYLTHDSAAGRKQQRRGWKFRENFRLHYEKHLDSWRSGPMGLASAQQGYIRAARQGNPHLVPPLAEGWKEEVDEVTGITYYVEEATQRRTWVRPAFVPPPGPPPGFGGPPPPGYSNRPPFGQQQQQQQQQQPPFGGPPPPPMGGPPPPFGGPPPQGGFPPSGGPPPFNSRPGM